MLILTVNSDGLEWAHFHLRLRTLEHSVIKSWSHVILINSLFKVINNVMDIFDYLIIILSILYKFI